MCGITAIISSDLISESLLKDMNDMIEHRGPDGHGLNFYQNKFNLNVGLGHRRLSILDLSENGHQPMSYRDRYVITYNGEIYNYIELKRELEKEGYTFNSETDTEVIMAAYDKWGEDCQHHFNGMWSFALLDLFQKRVFFSRDRFGIKPLYFYQRDESLYIASEIKQFTLIPNWRARLNQQMAYDFLAFGISDHTHETSFKNVFQLKGGYCFGIDLADINSIKNFSPRQWYKPQVSYNPINEQEAIYNFRLLLKDSIKLRLRSDVAVGSCLSGGLDSSSIVCQMSELLNIEKQEASQHTFSACSKYKKFDERSFIDLVLNKVNCSPSFTYPDYSSLFQNLKKITWHQDAPFASTSIFAQWKVFELAKENKVPVVLDGQGADELLAGYHPFFKPFLFRLFSSLKFKTLTHELIHLKNNHGYGLSHFINSLLVNILPEFSLNILRNLSNKNPTKPNWLNFKNFNINYENPRNYKGIQDIKRMSEKLIFSTNLPMLLRYEDRNSMAFSIESRVPFLDYRLVEFIFSLPSQLLIKNGETKYILRNSMKESIPSEIANRNDKMGFVTPEEIWIKENKDNLFSTVLEEAVERTDGIIRPEILSEFKRFQVGERPYNQDFWKVISYSKWMDTFSVSI